MLDKAKALVEFKGYVTNLAVSDEHVSAAYHQLWHVVKSFRMSKSDFKARPIFHQTRESIESHLTVVLAALAMGKVIKNRVCISIKRFVKTLRSVRSGVVIINGKEYPAEAEIPSELIPLIQKLQAEH